LGDEVSAERVKRMRACQAPRLSIWLGRRAPSGHFDTDYWILSHACHGFGRFFLRVLHGDQAGKDFADHLPVSVTMMARRKTTRSPIVKLE